MPNYQVEALRTIRSLQEAYTRAGHSAQAEQMRRIGDQVEAMQVELAALKAKANMLILFAQPMYEDPGHFAVTKMSLDALTALVGEG